MKSQVIRIDKARAELFLSCNTNNRKVNDGRVKMYAEDMRRGNWIANGEPIQFDTTGRMINGQHRLLALIMADYEDEFLVVTGVDPAAMLNLDGALTRTVGQNWTLIHNICQDDAKAISTLCKYAITYDKGLSISLGGGNPLRTNAEVDKYLKNNMQDILDSVAFVKSNVTSRTAILPKSDLSFLHYIFKKVDPFVADDFMTKMIKGTGLTDQDPIWMLRQIIDKSKKDRKQRLTPSEIIYTAIKAFNRYIRGNTYKNESSMKFRSEKNITQVYPVAQK